MRQEEGGEKVGGKGKQVRDRRERTRNSSQRPRDVGKQVAPDRGESLIIL